MGANTIAKILAGRPAAMLRDFRKLFEAGGYMEIS
jgi:hypothetical protein